MMNQRLLRKTWVLVCTMVCLLSSMPCFAGEFRAFSLREANRLLSSGQGGTAQLQTMGGITRFAGMVFDPETQDVILVGRVRTDQPPVSLDDLVVALRSRLQKKDYPRVSIDRVEATEKTGLQEVRFDGGIRGTQFGSDFLNSDVVLKQYSLSLLDQVAAIEPYLKLYEQATTQKLLEQRQSIDQVRWLSEEDSKRAVEQRKGDSVQESDMVQSRFWFHVRPDQSYIVEKDGVYVIEELSLGVKVESTFAETRDKNGNSSKREPDKAAEKFAHQFSESFRRVSEKHMVLQRLKTLFDLVAISEGIAQLNNRPTFDSLVNRYAVQNIPTPETYRLVRRVGEFKTKDRVAALVELSGGIELEALLLALEDGDVSALRTAVLASRPSAQTLTWELPLDGWKMPNDVVAQANTTELKHSGNVARKELGFGLSVQRYMFGDKHTDNQPPRFTGFASPPPMPYRPAPSTQPHHLDQMLSSQERTSSNIGGVMLSGVARVIDGNNSSLNSASRDFSLLVRGLDRGSAPSNFGKFVTALWSIYYSKEDPGISIDPIARGADKQLVRYLGRVINTDLGRVMREADYLMKKWAVGTEKPNIPGFRDVDAIAGTDRMTLTDATRRFWFVPENMTFKGGDGVFLFDHGRVTLQTEIMEGRRESRALESDRVFARFFTEHYEQIAAKYQIFSELFEYAKLVSLAKYLKQQGVPLHWFLMAHLDEVITEDSTGSVDTLSKGSRYLKDVRIEGGVEMNGRYVLDTSAAAAIQRAVARVGQPHEEVARPAPPVPSIEHHRGSETFAVEKQVFSILPQHSVTSGTDLRGVRYQTDVAIRQGTEPGLELVRYFRPPSQGDYSKGEFGNGWYLLRPYRIVPVGKPTVPFLNVLVPAKVAVRNLMTGRDEILVFDDKRYELAGYRPVNMAHSRIVGLFWTVAGCMRLVDKLGNEFWFNEGLMLSEMHYSDEFGLRFDYGHEEAGREVFDRAPYRLEPEGKGAAADIVKRGPEGKAVPMPNKLKLTHVDSGKSAIFIYGENNVGMLGYTHDAYNALDYEFIALRGDGTHVLIDANGNEVWFDTELRFVKYRPLLVKAVVQGAYQWNAVRKSLEFVENHTAQLEYEFHDGGFRIVGANVFRRGLSSAIQRVTYRYVADSMLASVVAQ